MLGVVRTEYLSNGVKEIRVKKGVVEIIERKRFQADALRSLRANAGEPGIEEQNQPRAVFVSTGGNRKELMLA